ncbi:MAG: prepilin-type N-terminal cleavage/methylation domain-containing protein [Puniceicoccales bacterium]|nr:prepilin-type N-terminal cleavage/methylation domain-containing protein [Puniceicoccales bacterium]
MNRRGYLLIEVIIGLSIFALVAGVVTQGFLVGLDLYKNASDADPNEGIIATILVNRIKNSMSAGSSFEIGLGQEKWKLTLKEKTPIASISPQLYALAISIAKIAERGSDKPIDKPIEKEYAIFRHF